MGVDTGRPDGLALLGHRRNWREVGQALRLSGAPLHCLGCLGDCLVEMVLGGWLDFLHRPPRVGRPRHLGQAVVHRMLLCVFAVAAGGCGVIRDIVAPDPNFRCITCRLGVGEQTMERTHLEALRRDFGWMA